MSNHARTGMRLEEDELRQVAEYSATCARQVLPVFEASCPFDPRPREAIAEAEAFAAGTRRSATLRASAWAAYTAAREREGESPAAAHAAYAASLAAAAAYLHPIASPHQVKHILGAAIHQALAFECGAENDREIGSERLRWAGSLANATVRDVLRRFPPPPPGGRGRFRALLSDLDTALRD